MPKYGIHELKANHNCEFTRRWVIVDTETWTQRDRVSETEVHHRLRLGHAIYMRLQNDKWSSQEFAFTTTQEFHDWLDAQMAKEKKVRIVMAAHNAAFDYPILEMDKYLHRPGWKNKFFIPKDPFLSYNTHLESGNRFDIISTTNWYHQSLKELAERFGSFKLESPNFKTSDWSVSDRSMARYCRQDTLALAEIVRGHIKYIQDNDLGCLKDTAAGQALQAFRHRFMHTKLLVHHHPKLIPLELEAFRGGRVEIFNQRGFHKGMYILDVNSMYPAVMRSNLFPIAPIKVGLLNASAVEPERWRERAMIAKCDLDLKLPCVGVRRDKSLLFPVGRVKAVLTSPELEYIYTHPEAGRIVRMGACGIYDQEVVFDEYMDFFTKEKETAGDDEVKRTASKLFMNALFGKFSQKLKTPIKYLEGEELENRLAGMEEVNMTLTPEYRFYKTGDDQVMQISRRGGDEVASDSIPRISAFVTAYARMLLWDMIMKAGIPEVRYVDTDSLFVTKLGYDRLQTANLVHPTETGKLKLITGPKIEEGKNKGKPLWTCPVNVDLLAPKFYRIGRQWKRKGVSKKAIRVKGEDYTWTQEQFKTGMSRYRDGIIDAVPIVTVTKRNTLEYKKGEIDSDNNITPKVFADW